MTRDFEPADLESALETGYGVRVASLAPLAGHAHSLNFKAVCDDGTVFAAKCFPAAKAGMFARLLAHAKSAGELASNLLFDGRTLDFGRWKVVALRWIDGTRMFPDDMTQADADAFLSAYRAFLAGLKDDGRIMPARDSLRIKKSLLAFLGDRDAPEIVRELKLMPDESLELAPEARTIIHGDLHWENFRFKDGKVSGFLDLEELRFGTPAEDMVRYVVCRAEHQRWYDIGGRKRLLAAFRRFLAGMNLTRAEWLYAIDGYLLRKLDKKLASGKLTWSLRMNLRYRFRFYRALRDAVYEAIPRERRDGRVVVKIFGGTVKRFVGGKSFDWGDGYRFVCDPSCRDYDWLCVYDEIPDSYAGVSGGRMEVAPNARTMLVTQEPTSVKFYNRAYTGQFDVLLTNRPKEAENHPCYVKGEGYMVSYTGRSFAEEIAHEVPGKTKCLSAIYSAKRMTHTLHGSRYALLERLRGMPVDFDWYGKGVRPIENKFDALDGYRYTVAFENHVGPGHWTEKLTDALVTGCLPFYAGDPEVGRLLPEGCFIPIPPDDPEKALAIILDAVGNDEWTKRRDAIMKARALIFEKYNLFAQVAKAIESASPSAPAAGRSIVTRRHTRLYPCAALADLAHHVSRIFKNMV